MYKHTYIIDIFKFYTPFLHTICADGLKSGMDPLSAPQRFKRKNAPATISKANGWGCPAIGFNHKSNETGVKINTALIVARVLF